jgi:hypothetical protein
MKGPPIGFVLALPSNSKTQVERVTKGKTSSLLGLVVSDKGKKFYNIDVSSSRITEAGLLNQSSHKAAAKGATKFITVNATCLWPVQ